MRAQRIKTGFHRIAVVLGSLCLVPAFLMTTLGLYWISQGDPRGPDLLMFGAAWLLAAVAAYGAAKVLGWIVAGFVGDGEISN